MGDTWRFTDLLMRYIAGHRLEHALDEDFSNVDSINDERGFCDTDHHRC
jgi:hypothetical protein